MTKPKHLWDGDTFEHNGRTFRFECKPDDCSEPPWDWCDGHGPVSDWTTRDKRPGEWVLSTEGNSRRYYDAQEAQKIAVRDGWSAAPHDVGTKRERAARAVAADFDYLRRWCNDDWCYCVIGIHHDESGESDYLGMVDDSDAAYLVETAFDIAGEISSRLDDEMATAIQESRPDMMLAEG